MANWYYFNKSGEKIGPITSAALKALAQQGHITPETIIESETGKQAFAGDVKSLEFAETPVIHFPPQPIPIVEPSLTPPTTLQVQYEYKCVAAPMILSIAANMENRATMEAKSVASYGQIINKECYDLWEFYSMEQITIANQPGCLAIFLGAKAGNTVYNMLVFRRPKIRP